MTALRTWGIALALTASMVACEKSPKQQGSVTPKDKATTTDAPKPPATKPAATKPAAKPPAMTTNANKFEATLKIDAKPGGKKFQGVWLVKADGSKMVIDYRANGLWRPFENQKVAVTGMVYIPRGQAIGAKHFRVETINIVDKQSTARFIALGPRKLIEGEFGTHTIKAGAKAGGQTYTIFKSKGGTTYQVMNPDKAEKGPVKVRARSVTRSPFTAHVGGPALWIINVTKP